MKKSLVYFCAAMLMLVAACKGTDKASSADSASTIDSGQTHVGNENPADSAKLPATPNETGGKDTSGNGSGTTNAPKDTLKKNQ